MLTNFPWIGIIGDPIQGAPQSTSAQLAEATRLVGTPKLYIFNMFYAQ